jgi:hypothetical protein
METPDDQLLSYSKTSPRPWAVMTASVIWIVFGVLILLSLVVTILLKFAYALIGANQAELNDLSARICGLSIASVIGFVFLMGGVQSIRGIPQDTLIKGMGSILLALLLLGLAALLPSQQ